MQRNLKSKFKKFTTIGLASAMLLTATPLNFANAEGTQTPVATTNQEVAKQALQSYLADSKGLFTAKATAETVNLPFSSELYYGYELLQDEEAKKAFEEELLEEESTTCFLCGNNIAVLYKEPGVVLITSSSTSLHSLLRQQKCSLHAPGPSICCLMNFSRESRFV